MQAKWDVRLSIKKHQFQWSVQIRSRMLFVVEPVVVVGKRIDAVFPGKFPLLSPYVRHVRKIIIAKLGRPRYWVAQTIPLRSIPQAVPIGEVYPPKTIVDLVSMELRKIQRNNTRQ